MTADLASAVTADLESAEQRTAVQGDALAVSISVNAYKSCTTCSNACSHRSHSAHTNWTAEKRTASYEHPENQDGAESVVSTVP